MSVLLLKNRIRNKFPRIAEQLSRMRWCARLKMPVFHPPIFKTVSQLSKQPVLISDNKNSQNILFFAVRQDTILIACQFVIAQALKIRSHKINYIACDGLIRHSCNESWYPELKKHVCKRCHLFCNRLYSLANFDVNWLSSFSSPSLVTEATHIIDGLDFLEYRLFEYDSLPLGELVRCSVSHFCRVENIELFGESDPIIRKIYKDFLTGAVMMVEICRRILKECSPDIIVTANGKFMAERIMLETAKRSGIRTVVFEAGLTPDTLMLFHNHYIDYGKVDGWEERRLLPLTDEEEEACSKYLTERRTGKGQTMDYFRDLNENKKAIYNQLGLEQFKKVAVLFPNVTWDSALSGLQTMFNNVQEWVSKTIDYFQPHPEVCLIIRSHPADMTWHAGMRDSIFRWVQSTYSMALPSNIKVIAPDSTISSYALMEMADVGLAFASTAGLEMVLFGKPVIVVGKAHYWNKGFTIDPMDEDEYYRSLDNFLIFDNKAQVRLNVELARRYTYFIFFEASLPFKLVNSDNYRSLPRLEFSSYEDLFPGKDAVLDLICDGISQGKPFVLQTHNAFFEP